MLWLSPSEDESDSDSWSGSESGSDISRWGDTGFLWFPNAVLKARLLGCAGLAGGPVRLCVSVLVEGVRERPSVFVCWLAVDNVGSMLGWRNTPEPPDPIVGVGLSRIRAERAEGALWPISWLA